MIPDSPRVPVILLVGETGTGKSTFINMVLAKEKLELCRARVNSGLETAEEPPRAYSCTLDNGRRVYLVDTPGLDATNGVGAMASMKAICDWFKKNAKNEMPSAKTFAGILYLRPPDNRRLPLLSDLEASSKLGQRVWLVNKAPPGAVPQEKKVSRRVAVQKEFMLNEHIESPKKIVETILDGCEEIGIQDGMRALDKLVKSRKSKAAPSCSTWTLRLRALWNRLLG